MKITAHTLVKNEERFLWYSVTSVIDHVDKMLLWDTGSTDSTIDIIKELKKKYPQKIESKFLKQKDIYHFTKIRQQMLEATKTDWFIIVDGDEIWWDDSIKLLRSTIKENQKLDYIISSYYSPVGDLFHYQTKNQAKYNINNHQGHINVRATSTKIPGLHFDKPHGQQGLYDVQKKLIQKNSNYKYLYLDEPAYIHVTNLHRSSTEDEKKVSKRKQKYKISRGIEFPLDFYYPESFFKSRPDIVPNIWKKRDGDYETKAYILDMLRFVKRVLPLPERSGY